METITTEGWVLRKGVAGESGPAQGIPCLFRVPRSAYISIDSSIRWDYPERRQ